MKDRISERTESLKRVQIYKAGSRAPTKGPPHCTEVTWGVSVNTRQSHIHTGGHRGSTGQHLSSGHCSRGRGSHHSPMAKPTTYFPGKLRATAVIQHSGNRGLPEKPPRSTWTRQEDFRPFSWEDTDTGRPTRQGLLLRDGSFWGWAAEGYAEGQADSGPRQHPATEPSAAWQVCPIPPRWEDVSPSRTEAPTYSVPPGASGPEGGEQCLCNGGRKGAHNRREAGGHGGALMEPQMVKTE